MNAVIFSVDRNSLSPKTGSGWQSKNWVLLWYSLIWNETQRRKKKCLVSLLPFDHLLCPQQFMIPMLRCSQSAYYHPYLSTKWQHFFISLSLENERCELNSKSEKRKMKRTHERCWKMWPQKPFLGSLSFSLSLVRSTFLVRLAVVVGISIFFPFRWRIKCDPKMLHVFDASTLMNHKTN